MKKICSIIALCGIAIGAITLAGCSPPPAPKPPISPEQQRCLVRCQNARSTCLTQRTKIYQQCAINAKRIAHLEFKDYAREQTQKGKKLKKTWRNFIDTSQCGQPLQCKSQYAACFSSCGL